MLQQYKEKIDQITHYRRDLRLHIILDYEQPSFPLVKQEVTSKSKNDIV